MRSVCGEQGGPSVVGRIRVPLLRFPRRASNTKTQVFLGWEVGWMSPLFQYLSPPGSSLPPGAGAGLGWGVGQVGVGQVGGSSLQAQDAKM